MNDASSSPRLWLRALPVVGAIVVAAMALFAGVFAYTRDDGSGSANDAEVQALYDRMLVAMTREGMVLHTRSVVYECEQTDLWIDAAAEIVREQFTYLCNESASPGTRRLYRDDEWWQVEENGTGSTGTAARTCGGSENEAVIHFLGCYPRDADVTVLHDQAFEGEMATVLRSVGGFDGIDSHVEFDTRLYVDSTTGLPVGVESDIRDDYGGPDPEPERITRKYVHEFVERASLDGDLFEPSGIGYTEESSSNAD